MWLWRWGRGEESLMGLSPPSGRLVPNKMFLTLQLNKNVWFVSLNGLGTEKVQ